MTTTPKIFLALSATSFALSFAPVFTDFGWGALRPLSAVTFIVFLITQMLAREMALYDAEQKQKYEQLGLTGKPATKSKNNPNEDLTGLQLAK